jgi:hypothetical protein
MVWPSSKKEHNPENNKTDYGQDFDRGKPKLGLSKNRDRNQVQQQNDYKM